LDWHILVVIDIAILAKTHQIGKKDICKKPLCDVNRTCPEHIFKGQRDPRLGPPDESNKTTNTPSPSVGFGSVSQGANCGK
jgi:hypothetical protein